MAEAPNVWQPVILLAVLLQPLLTFYPGPTVDTLPRRAGAVLAVLTCTNTVVGEDDWGDTRVVTQSQIQFGTDSGNRVVLA